MKTALTDRAVAQLVAPEHGRLEVLDTKMPGLAPARSVTQDLL